MEKIFPDFTKKYQPPEYIPAEVLDHHQEAVVYYPENPIRRSKDRRREESLYRLLNNLSCIDP